MHVELHPSYRNTPEGDTARDIINACVHCGFCLATCPTYLDSRDERDSPRGRIYLIKNLLETGQASEQTQTHLDRCLSCRSCETTCPSGVNYGRLADLGRNIMEQQAPRPVHQRSLRAALRMVFSKPSVLTPLLRVGQFFRPVLPRPLRLKIPPRQTVKAAPTEQHARTMLVLAGCVQSAATPNTNTVAARVLNKLGITLLTAPKAGCCGAVNYHLGAQADGLDNMRANIDSWWPYLEAGAEAIVSSASGCGSMLVEYGELLAHDPTYADKAQRISAMCRDIGEILLQEDLTALQVNTGVGAVAVHTPCTLQHALKLPDLIPTILSKAGFTLAATTDKHLCCGSAGTYSILQPAISGRLLDNKVRALTQEHPAVIATGNVGCQLQLTSGVDIPVVHWIELLDPA